AFVDLIGRGWVSHLSPQYFVQVALYEGSRGGVIFTTVIISNLLSVAAILLIVLIKGQPFKDYLAFHEVRLRTLFKWMGVLVAFMILADLIGELTGIDLGGDSMVKLFQSTHPAWLFWIAAVLAAPLFEEVMFRGLLFRGFQASFLGTGGTVVLTAILWAAMHLQYNLYGMGFIALTGILFGTARARTGSLLVPMAMHAALNFSDLLLFTMSGPNSS
ncbi:MAG TPA: CPBP family intramembrane glutamic endopeptidase, partial [Alphaproteobacteria bacterium]|nr:CPBP family intramembrane glutamic endopeptidase [Alphaproteobacteria bacterium]